MDRFDRIDCRAAASFCEALIELPFVATGMSPSLPTPDLRAHNAIIIGLNPYDMTKKWCVYCILAWVYGL